MKEIEEIKCPKCGYKNIKLTKRCTNCRYDLDFNNKSCPKCGRINANSVKKCECGFNFTRKRRSLLVNIIITIVVMVILLIIYKLSGDLASKFNVALKAILVFSVFVMIVKTFTNAKSEEIAYSAEKEMLIKHKMINKMKKFSNASIIMGGIAVTIYLIYYYIFK